jgi:uncharacterized protein YecT (DUF1311 family)
MFNKFLIATAIFAVSLCIAQSAHAAEGPSFNCNWTKTPDEVAICQDEELSAMDREMALAYFDYINRYSAGIRDHVVREQRAWLKRRRACGNNPACIREVYLSLELNDGGALIAGFCEDHPRDSDCSEKTVTQTDSSGHAAARLTATAAAYDASWYTSKFWSGEYPPGFSVVEEHTVVMARAKMDKDAPRALACELPYLAVIHPWNTMRIKKNKIEFISATKIVPLIAKGDFVFDGYVGNKRVKLPVKKGTKLSYLRNNAEGAFEIEISGKQYTAGQDLYEHIEDANVVDRFVEDNWVLLTCKNGTRVYIYLNDLVSENDHHSKYAPGIADVGPGLTGYGKARDLTPAEARKLADRR